MRTALRLCAGALILSACGGNTETGSLRPSGDDIWTPPPVGGFDAEGRWHDVPGEAGVRAPSAFAVWLGEVELHVSNELLPDEEDPWVAFRPERLTLVLGLDAHGAPIGGTLTFGATAPLPPPTDPEAWYPSGFIGPDLVPRIWPGFEYPLRSLLASGTHLGFSLAPGDVFTAWCALQTPHPVEEGFACFDGPSPSASPRAVLCRGPEPACVCDAAGCRENASFRIPFEVVMDGDRALGRVLGRAGFWDLSLARVDEISLPVGE